MVMLPGRVKPIWPRAASMAALAWSALLSPAGGIVFPLAGIAQPGALAADPAAPQLKVSRCRSSFICGQLAAGTPLGELLAITGICQAESLGRYAPARN
jgi:hypothetical protein